jgi:hypothetical protein
LGAERNGEFLYPASNGVKKMATKAGKALTSKDVSLQQRELYRAAYTSTILLPGYKFNHLSEEQRQCNRQQNGYFVSGYQEPQGGVMQL